ncbi:MAG: ABC transporter substrate-binding protein [Lachnospiraceae bacterium]|nr:ABC transporter substrate-binding protein [Lachnospiraceae bacterium]
MKKRCLKPLFLTAVLFSLTIALTGCSGDKASDSSSEITIGLAQDIEDSLDPHKAVAAGTKEILFNLYEGLVKPDADGNLIDAVASAHEVSEDGKTYTFTLRDGVKFHDGSLVTADDVKYSIDRCADTGNGDPLVSAFSNIESVNVLDESTIEVNLKEADTEFLAYMTTAIIPASNETPDTNPIGTGPYKYVSRSPQEEIVLERFDEYWGTPANIANITLKVIADPDSIAMNLNGGAIDMFMRITTGQMNELSDEFEIYEGTMNLVQALYLNNDFEPFQDVRVRRALCYAVDKQEIFDILSDGKGSELGSSVFPSFGKYYMEELNSVYTKDTKKAKELLAEAGYENGFTFSVAVPSNYQPHVDTAQILAQQFKEIGVTANINLIEWDSWLSDVYTNREFEATVIGVDASSLTARALLERFQSDASNNFINFKSDAYDTAITNALATADDDEKTRYYKECETILADEAANVYIQDLPEFVALNKKYAGYEFYPLYVQDFSKLYVVEE